MLAEVEAVRAANGSRLFACMCSCGTEITLNGAKLTRGHTKSCGCLRRERGRSMLLTHGLANTPTWRCWASMRQRCTDANCAAFRHYGGRGITVCAPWLASYGAFLADVGERPSQAHSLGRIDNDGNYEPGNVRWETWAQQGINKRSNVRLTVDGETLTVGEWTTRAGFASTSTIKERLKRGWSAAEAVTPGPRLKHRRTGDT